MMNKKINTRIVPRDKIVKITKEKDVWHFL